MGPLARRPLARRDAWRASPAAPLMPAAYHAQIVRKLTEGDTHLARIAVATTDGAAATSLGQRRVTRAMPRCGYARERSSGARGGAIARRSRECYWVSEAHAGRRGMDPDVSEGLSGRGGQSRANRSASIRACVRSGARSAQVRTNGRRTSEPPHRHRRRGVSRSSRTVPAPPRNAPERTFPSRQSLPFARNRPDRARHPARDAPIRAHPSQSAPRAPRPHTQKGRARTPSVPARPSVSRSNARARLAWRAPRSRDRTPSRLRAARRAPTRRCRPSP